MKKKLLTTAILLTGLLSASTYHYTFKISDTSLFNNSQSVSYNTPEERTGVQSTGVILASDGGVDWYGEVSAENFISGNDLASLIGLTAGTAINPNAGWLHVGIDGKELFIAKNNFRSLITWNYLNNNNIIYGNRTIEINNQEYIIRIISGSLTPSTVYAGGFDQYGSHGSEYNRIFYRLTDENYSNNSNTKSSEEPFVNLANYSETDFQIINQPFWAQEFSSTYNTRIVFGTRGISFRNLYPATSDLGNWRPVLEKVN